MSDSSTKKARVPLLAIVAGALALAAVAFWVSRRPGADAAEVAVRPAPRDCQACKQQSCAKPLYQLDCARVGGTAAAGPAAGHARRDLCAAAVACVEQQHCAAPDGDLRACYCGAGVDVPECLQGGRGPCRAVLEQAAETTDPRTLAERWNDPNFALGHATHVAGCESHECQAACAP